MTWNGSSLAVIKAPSRELKLWNDRTGSSALLSTDGAAVIWRRATIHLVWSNYAVWLGWLESAGEYDPRDLPENRITPIRVRRYVSAMRERGNACSTIYLRIIALERVLSVLAPKADRTWLRTLLSKLPKGGGASGKRYRLQETSVLFELGIKLMKGVQGLGSRPSRAAVTHYRDGLKISLLSLRPLRRANFAAMAFGKHLVRQGSGWQIQFASEETKGGKPYSAPFPPDLLPFLEDYVAIYRPLLAGSRYTGPAVWVSYRFTELASDSFYDRIITRTADAFGQPLNPHLFRDAVATSIAINDPEIVGISHAVLGNCVETCERYYNLAQSHHSGSKLQTALMSIKSRVKGRP